MSHAWHEPGYPQRHYDAVRGAHRYARGAIAMTGGAAVLLVLGTVFGSIPPLVAAIAVAIFLLFGLLGGIAGIYETQRHVRLVPYFQRKLGDIETFVGGQALARSLAQLDGLAVAQKVTPISYFGFNDDLAGETLIWHAPADGLRTVKTLLACLERQHEVIAEDVVSDLLRWRDALQKATNEDVPFCVLLMHGNMTSGHEWDVRQGSAF